MTHSHRRKASSNSYFRMDVPKDIRDLAGVTSWQRSLDTADLTLAEARRSSYAAHYKGEIIRLRALKADRRRHSAASLVDEALTRLARFFGSMDRAIAAELTRVATIVRSSWSNEHARAVELQHLAESYTGYSDDEPVPIPAIDTEHARQMFRVRAEVFEGKDLSTDGLVYQELARALLVRGVYEPLRFVIGYLPYLVPRIDLSNKGDYDAITQAYLTRLADHDFSSYWPDGIREALAPIVAPIAQPDDHPPAAVSVPPRIVAGPTLKEAFDAWVANRGRTGRDKTTDEFRLAIARFEEICGTSDVTLITTEMVETFAATVAKMPARAKKDVATLPILEQIARAERDKLPTLQAPTVGKQVAGIRSVLAIAKRKKWIAFNPATDIAVAGAKWQGDERDHFSDEDMRRIYTSPLMTDPDACSDTMFWILFLAPFHGSRPGEHCKLKPNEIVQEEDAWVMRFRRDRPGKFDKADPTSMPRRQKTRHSVRDVPLHWIVLEGGFLDYVAHQRNLGAEWLFNDLKVDSYGDRYKLLSNEINRALRRIGIDAANKAFYSTRHTMKREGRRRRIDRQSLDQIAGHASSHVGDRYGQGLPIEILKEDIDRLEFRSVPWDAVVACARTRVRRLIG
ncbi:hypothetical protein QLH51_07640 [Sphingomonas sp. 2R-10]|uniref:DUF6538 domain-containing protein n=1 Tax=Sphingomonas sp. 2R-10 TaxID=3045148 RepID=UPI000F766E48|nr:DUF6538 domain-containing protein [Sphingomonas sp. 2R-10]MDJ0276664.1 hypothetical protein [Sphingomonas sp. 2R-10]